MSAQLIEPTDVIDVSSLAVLIYGQPGSGKTSLAQTAEDPFTLDLDFGAHRSAFRKTIMRFYAWDDVNAAQPEIAKHKTVNTDTVGRFLDLMTADIVKKNAKHGSPFAGLSLQGFGVLKARFAQWVGQLNLTGKDRIFIAHQKEEKDGDNTILRPDITGGSYGEVMKFTDLVGYLKIVNGRRVLDFNPTDYYVGKNAAGWPAMEVPDLAKEPHFLANLLADAKAKIGKTAEASAALAVVVDDWSVRLNNLDGIDQLNAALPDLGKISNGAKRQAWTLILQYAESKGFVFDKAAKKFVQKGATA